MIPAVARRAGIRGAKAAVVEGARRVAHARVRAAVQAGPARLPAADSTRWTMIFRSRIDLFLIL
jgi:hypothetical protein